MVKDHQIYFDLLQNLAELEKVPLNFLKDLAATFPLHQPLQALLVKKMLLDGEQDTQIKTKANLKIPFVEYVYQQAQKITKLPQLPPLFDDNEEATNINELNNNDFFAPKNDFAALENEPLLIVEEIIQQNIEPTSIDDEKLEFVEDDFKLNQTDEEWDEEEDFEEEPSQWELNEEDLILTNEDLHIIDDDEIAISDGEPPENNWENSTINAPKNRLEALEELNFITKAPKNKLEVLEELSLITKPLKDEIVEPKPSQNQIQEEEPIVEQTPIEQQEAIDAKLENIRKMLFDEGQDILPLDNEQKKSKTENEPIFTSKITQQHEPEQELSLMEKLVEDIKKEKQIIEANKNNNQQTQQNTPQQEIDENVRLALEQELASLQVAKIDTSNDSVPQLDESIIKQLEQELKMLKKNLSIPLSNTDKALDGFDNLMQVVKHKFGNEKIAANEKIAVNKKRNIDIEQRVSEGENVKNALVTETMARFLEEKGEILEAIKVNEALKLKFPQKSNYFAVEIERLNRKL